MKKLIPVSFLAFSSLVLANSQEQINLAIKEKQPMAVVRVFDTSVKPHKIIEGNQLSRSKPRQLCLFVINATVQDKNLFANYLQAPAPLTLTVNNARVQVDDSKKNYLIAFDMMRKDIKDNVPSQCWVFTPNDPIGTYKVDMQFNDIVFKNLEFKLLK